MMDGVMDRIDAVIKEDCPDAYKKKCAICGAEFLVLDTLHARTKYCSDECRTEASRITHRENRRLRKIEAGEPIRPQGRPRKEVTAYHQIRPRRTLVEVAVAARKAGMTYGQYVARNGL